MSEDDDAQLVALIDGELDESARIAIEARLADDARLRERLSLLLDGDRPFAPAFDVLLRTAPTQRLQARLAAVDQPSPQSVARRPKVSLRPLAAAAAFVLFALGVAVGRFGPSLPLASLEAKQEDWRQAVAEYMALYTGETFAGENPSKDAQLAALGGKIGLPLDTERIALANLQFKGAQIFSYDGATLGQVAYLDQTTGPLLFCIIRDQEPDAAMKTEKRGAFSVASWARGGRGFMVIGRLPTQQTAELANSLARRF